MRSVRFPWVSSKLSIQKSEQFGNHVVANDDIDVGEVVMETSGFANIEVLTSINSSCFHCGKCFDEKFIQCKNCIKLMFCSIKCRRSSESHRNICKNIFSSEDCFIVRLVYEMIVTALKQFQNIENMLYFTRRVLFTNINIENLVPPYSSYGEMLRLKGRIDEKYSAIAHRVSRYIFQFRQFETSQKRLIFHLAWRLSSTIEINCFSEDTMLEEGTCTRYSMYDALCRVNHSCSPNIDHYDDEHNMKICTATRPIKRGEQLFISYLGVMKFQTVEERKQYIQELWGFDCKCEQCRPDLNENNKSVKSNASKGLCFQAFYVLFCFFND